MSVARLMPDFWWRPGVSSTVYQRVTESTIICAGGTGLPAFSWGAAMSSDPRSGPRGSGFSSSCFRSLRLNIRTWTAGRALGNPRLRLRSVSGKDCRRPRARGGRGWRLHLCVDGVRTRRRFAVPTCPASVGRRPPAYSLTMLVVSGLPASATPNAIYNNERLRHAERV